MRDYSLPEGLWLTFFSKRFYQSVATGWRAKALAYLVLLMILTTLPGFIQVHRALNQAFSTVRAQMASNIPVITVDKGEVHTPENKPYEIHFGSGAHTWILIDTTGKTATLADTAAYILITKHQIFVRKSAYETHIYNLANVDHVMIDQERVDRWIDLFQKWFPVFFYPFLFAFQTAVRIFETVLLALVGLLMMRSLEAPLDFPPLWSLATTSLTPALLLQTFLSAAAIHFRFQGLWMFSLTLGYFLFAVNAATEPPEELV